MRESPRERDEGSQKHIETERRLERRVKEAGRNTQE